MKSKKLAMILTICIVIGSISTGIIIFSVIMNNSERRLTSDYKLFLSFKVDNCPPGDSYFTGLEIKLYILGNVSSNSTQDIYFNSHLEYYEVFNKTDFSWNETEENKSYLQTSTTQNIIFIEYTVCGEIYEIIEPSNYCTVNLSISLWVNGTWDYRNPVQDYLGSNHCVSMDRGLLL
jgi:hypothetical protein